MVLLFFSDCKNLESFEFYGKIINYEKQREEETLAGWFWQCPNLRTVILSKEIPSLNDTFETCSNLKEINFLGSESEWKKIKIVEEREPILQNIKINFNYRK